VQSLLDHQGAGSDHCAQSRDARSDRQSAADETDPAEADLETTIQNFLTGRYENALRVVAFNAAEGWSRDVSEEIAQELSQRAINVGDDLGEGAQRFVDRRGFRRPTSRRVRSGQIPGSLDRTR
jgi:hypothetical protein